MIIQTEKPADMPILICPPHTLHIAQNQPQIQTIGSLNPLPPLHTIRPTGKQKAHKACMWLPRTQGVASWP